MPAEYEPQSWGAWIAAFFGAGGGGAVIVKSIRDSAAMETRITSLEESRTDHEGKLETIGKNIATLTERSEVACASRERIEDKLDRLLER